MANIDKQATDDTGLSDEADTLTDEDSATSAFDDDDTSFEDVDDDTPTEEETKDEAATDSEEEPKEESDDSVDEADTDTEQVEEKAESKDDPAEEDTTKADAEAERKAHNDEMAKARIEAKRARDEAEAVKRQAKEDNIARYLEEAKHDEDLLRQREFEVKEYRLTEKAIELNEKTLQADVNRAVADIDLFRTGTPAVQERLLRALDTFENAHIVKTEDGRPKDINGDVYQYLQDEANSIKSLLGEGARQQVKQKSSQKARTTTTPVRTPAKPKVDADLAAFDEVANGW